MSKYIVMVFLLCVAFKPAFAADFASDVKILETADIAKLSDDKIQDIYLDTIVELDASKTFHNTSGFTPKDYTEYKRLVKFRLQLLLDMHRRNLEIPQFDRYNIN